MDNVYDLSFEDQFEYEQRQDDDERLLDIYHDELERDWDEPYDGGDYDFDDTCDVDSDF